MPQPAEARVWPESKSLWKGRPRGNILRQPAGYEIGELGGIRTLDLQIKSPLLYQLSYELPNTAAP